MEEKLDTYVGVVDLHSVTLEGLERMDVGEMTNGEMLAELVLGQREMRRLVKGFLESVEKNPMMKTMGRMFGG